MITGNVVIDVVIVALGIPLARFIIFDCIIGTILESGPSSRPPPGEQ